MHCHTFHTHLSFSFLSASSPEVFAESTPGSINGRTLHVSPPPFNSHSPPTLTERPPLRASYAFLPQCLQKTHKGLHGASDEPQRRVEGEESLYCSGQCLKVNWGTNSISMILHSNLLPQALLKTEFITQLGGGGETETNRVSPHTLL